MYYFCNKLTNTLILHMKKLLIAEDNDSNYILMTYILKNHYEFERARDGREAVDMAKKGGFDLVLMDIKMPVMDGLEATSLIKEQCPELPVIALTANAFDEDVQRSLQTGLNAHLTKPIQPEVLFETLESLIKTRNPNAGEGEKK